MKSKYFHQQSTSRLLELVEPRTPPYKSKREWMNEMVGSFDRADLIGGGEVMLPEMVKVRQQAMVLGLLEALAKNFKRVSHSR